MDRVGDHILGPGGAGGLAVDASLLAAKFTIPDLRSGFVSREGLIATARTSDCRVVGITAPAGYGKSTLLAEWAHAEDRPVAWVSLHRFDDDPALLLSLIATAFADAMPGTSPLVADMGGPGASVLGRMAPRLASAFHTSPIPFVVMLDDLQEVRSLVCQDVLSVAISGIPAGSQLVLASRSEQPHLARLRASGDAIEFGMSDLALDADGAAQIFSQAQVTLPRDTAVAVTERTEGWPVGLYLAALIAGDSGGEGLRISGDDRYVADYLYRESLTGVTEDQQRFLRCTAMLDQLCSPLCDAVLGEPGAQERLRRLEASSLFLIPLDRRREWYRYHSLFREFLLGELRRLEPDIIATLHLRAAGWYEANGAPALAVEHLLETSERDRCVQLVTKLAQPTYFAGEISTVQRWLSTLGDSAIEDYPPLAVLAGWAAALTGQTAEAERWAAILDRAEFDLAPADGTASFASARAMLRSFMCAGGPEQALADAAAAVAEEPPSSPWRDQALWVCGEAHLLTGDVVGAGALFKASSDAARNSPSDALVLSESQLALMAMDAGRWADSADHIKLALATIEELRTTDYLTSTLAFAGAARLALHQGDLNEMHRQLTRAMRVRPSCTLAAPAIAVRLRLQLAKVYVAIADPVTARHLLREIDDILRHRPALGALVDEVSHFRRMLPSTEQRGAAGVRPLTQAELRLLPYLQTHLIMSEIAKRLSVSRNTVSSQARSIYQKLGVSSRGDAVQRAMAIGLVGTGLVNG